jgi:hypothetical protein
MSLKIRFAATGILCLALAAQAGVTLTQSMQESGGQKPATTTTIRLDKDRVRMDMGQNPDTYMIYRGDKKVFWTVDLKRKTYMEMTEKDFEDMSAKMEEAMKKMEAQLQAMPPERRKMMEEMMAKMMPGGKASKTAYTKLGNGGKVGRWATEKYAGTREGAKVSEVWTAAPKSIGVGEEDVQVLKDMARFFEKFAKDFAGMIGDHENGLQGVPVKTVAYKDGAARWQSELKDAKKEDLAPALFEIPAGFSLKSIKKTE